MRKFTEQERKQMVEKVFDSVLNIECKEIVINEFMKQLELLDVIGAQAPIAEAFCKAEGLRPSDLDIRGLKEVLRVVISKLEETKREVVKVRETKREVVKVREVKETNIGRISSEVAARFRDKWRS